jgi:hypothetical protein
MTQLKKVRVQFALTVADSQLARDRLDHALRYAHMQLHVGF